MAVDILYIDDEVGMVELVQLVMEREGLTVLGAQTGDEGLTLMRRSPPRVLLLDIMMPDRDGWEVYKEIKADTELKDIPVIIVTARTDRLEEIIARTRARVDDYIKKPFTPDQLRQAVRKVLEQ